MGNSNQTKACKGRVRPNRRGRFLLPVVVSASVFACLGSPVKPEHVRLTPESFAKRQLQTRVFETDDKRAVLNACTATLQDIGFLVDESEVQLGLIVASKDRTAINELEVAVEVAAFLFALAFGEVDPPVYDENQILRISLVVMPVAAEQTGTAVRVTFQRIVFTNTGVVSRRETLHTPAIYQEFFSKLSKALYLEAHEL